MSNISASGSPQNISISNLKVTTPTITNFSLTLANTEYIIALPALTTRFRLQARGSSKLQISYAIGMSNTVFLTVWPGSFYLEDNINNVGLTLYVRSNKAGEVVELVSWI